MKKSIILTSIIAIVFSLMSVSVSAKTVEYTYSAETAAEDWTVTGDTAYCEFSDSGIRSSDWKKFKAVLNGYIFEDEFTYSVKAYNTAGGSSNAALILFNYVDESNYYCVELGGNAADRSNSPLTLSRCVR